MADAKDVLKLFGNLLNSVKKIPKQNSASEEFRLAGNKLFLAKKYKESLIEYNKAISYAEIKSEALGLAYANRSAVYYEIKLYDHSIRNIEHAKENNYPENLMQKLIEREKLCKAEIKKGFKTRKLTKDIEMKLSYTRNPQIPFTVDCIEIQESSKYGRGIYAKKDLNPGDIISLDTGVASTLKKECLHMRCCFCFKENRMDLLPCPECTLAMFCSKNCYEKGYEEFHKFECSLIDGILDVSTTTSYILPLRILWIGLSAFGTTQNFMDYYRTKKLGKIPVKFDIENMKQRYDLITSLTSEPVRDRWNTMIAEMFSKDENLGKYFKTEEEKEFLIEILSYYRGIIKLNVFDMVHWNTWDEHYSEQAKFVHNLASTGAIIYPYVSYFNHSCYPNVDRAQQGNVMVVYITRPVKKDEQLYVTYGKHFCADPLETRRDFLNKKYGFFCDCVACENNYKNPTQPSHSQLMVMKKFLTNGNLTSGSSHKAQLKQIAQTMKKPETVLDTMLSYFLAYGVEKFMKFNCREY